MPKVEKTRLCQKISWLANFCGPATAFSGRLAVERAHPCRILTVIAREQPVKLRIFGLEGLRRDEQRLAAHGEELRRVIGRIGIDQRVTFEALPAAFRHRIDLVAELVVGVVEHIGPRLRVERGVPASIKGRMTVGFAVEHVDLVRELVDDDVVGVAAVGHLRVFPREDHRAAFPRLAARVVLDFMHHAVLVLHGLADHKLARIDDHAHPALVQIEREIQHGQRGLGGDRHGHGVGKFEIVRGREFLLREEQAREFAQAYEIGGVEVAEKGQSLERRLPEHVVDRIGAQRLFAAARAEPAGEFRKHRVSCVQSICFCHAANTAPTIAAPIR
ncbi:hypothetical protein PT2222_250027 [Paraburkholderia tropica]